MTDRTIKALKPSDTRREIYDHRVPGLALRITPSGVKTWSVRYRVGGQQMPRLTLGEYPTVTLKKARKKAHAALRAVDGGANPAAEKRAARLGETVDDLVTEYLTRHAKPHKRSWREDARMLNAEILPVWQHQKVKNLTRRDVRALVNAIADRAPVAANRYLALVRKLLNFAVAQDWIDANPAALMAKPGAERSRERVLSDDELRLVWNACAAERPAMCALQRLRLVTAQRGGELAQVQWTDVEGDWLTLPATVTKNKIAHRVYLTALAKEQLAGLPHIEGCDYVFPGRSGNRSCGDHKKAAARIRRAVLDTLQEADATVTEFDFRGHDLRRTAATKLAQAGVSQADIAKVLNHVEGGPRATQVYNRYAYDREKQIALETWARTLTAILAATPQAGVDVVPITREVVR